ncbi:MAG: glycosyltransferase [Candidatus Kapaibacterium sp.]
MSQKEVTSNGQPPQPGIFKRYYRKLIANYLGFYLPPGANVLIVGDDALRLAYRLTPEKCTAIATTEEEAAEWRSFLGENVKVLVGVDPATLDEQFDVVILSNVIGYWSDIQTKLEQIRTVCHSGTRLMITHYSALWQPLIRLAERLGMKNRQPYASWLAPEDIANLLHLADFDVVRKNFKVLCPIYIPLIAELCNYVLANLPFFWRLSLVEFVSARLTPQPEHRTEQSVTVLIPTHNEMGNIEPALRRVPMMGTHTEIIFVDGHSSDGTMGEIQAQMKNFPDLDIAAYMQDGKGKGDAVRKGFDLAKGDILMILDADLTVPPEDLPKFYEAIVSGKGEYINGTRLVYPMEKEAMRFLNTLGNKFFSRAFTYLLEQRFKDTLCGTKVISRENYRKLAANRHYFGDFDPFGDFDLIFGAAKLNLKIVEVPIRYRARTYGDTSISRFKHGWILLKMCVFAFRKIKLT